MNSDEPGSLWRRLPVFLRPKARAVITVHRTLGPAAYLRREACNTTRVSVYVLAAIQNAQKNTGRVGEHLKHEGQEEISHNRPKRSAAFGRRYNVHILHLAQSPKVVYKKRANSGLRGCPRPVPQSVCWAVCFSVCLSPPGYLSV